MFNKLQLMIIKSNDLTGLLKCWIFFFDKSWNVGYSLLSCKLSLCPYIYIAPLLTIYYASVSAFERYMYGLPYIYQ